jgi:carboxyl-terminal processing protease
LALVVVLALAVMVVGAPAPPADEQLRAQITARVVAILLERNHMAKPHIDDEIAKQWCQNFVKDLDPQKLYFLKGDVDEFLAQATTLDDKLREGDIDFAKTVFELFLKRSEQRLQSVFELLKKKPDFTLDESMVDDPDRLDYPKDDQEAYDRWRKRIKYDWLQEKILDNANDADIVKKLTIRYRDRNRIFHQFELSDLMEFYLTSLTKTFDPHSSYMSPHTLEDTIEQTLKLSLEGIGASLQSEDGYAVVKEIIPGMAADKDGRLQPEDKIVGIQNADNSETDLVEKKLSDVVRYIRGPAGTKVRLIVQPAETKERKIYELTRQKIELVEAKAKGQLLKIPGANGKELKVGVINLPNFYGDTQAVIKGEANAVSATVDCRRLIEGFKRDGVDAVMVDLRGNGGGLLQEAISLSGLFIRTGPVVQIKEVTGIKQLVDEDEAIAWEGPLVVLIDHLSASASEIFAGVIKDYGRGLIIGDASTFGKGTVQSIMPVDEQLRRRNLPVEGLGALKLTIQQFYRVNGESTQIRGVRPDIHIPSIRDQMEFGEEKMDNALKFDKVPSLPHARFERVPADLVARLDARSRERRHANPEFRKQEERIKKFIERKERHSISLNEAKFRAEYVLDDDIDKLLEERAKAKQKAKRKYHEHPAWESDYYNDEIVKIVSDYLTMGPKVVASAPNRVGDSR